MHIWWDAFSISLEHISTYPTSILECFNSHISTGHQSICLRIKNFETQFKCIFILDRISTAWYWCRNCIVINISLICKNYCRRSSLSQYTFLEFLQGMLYLIGIYLIQDATEKRKLSNQTMTLNLKNFQAT